MKSNEKSDIISAMTIKKPMKKEGATIASRFRLDTTTPVKTSGGKATTVAFSAAMLSLAVAGVLVYLLWKHWEFLMKA